MSVPLYSTSEALPMGVQFIARFGQEGQLLKLANQLHTARSWSQNLPKWVTTQT
jgi:amidase